MRTLIRLCLAIVIIGIPAELELAAQGPVGTNIRIVPLRETAIPGRNLERDLNVQVQDISTGPVGGAQVTFTIQDQGTGTFSNGESSMTVFTDRDGLAVASGFRFRNPSARVNVSVDGFYRTATASTMVTVGGPPERFTSNRTRRISIIAIAGSAALAVILLAARGESQPPAREGIVTIRVGGPAGGPPAVPTIGPPR